MVIEVFKTNVRNKKQANELATLLLQHFPGTRINFDLADCDRVLRIEGQGFTTDKVIQLSGRKGVACTVLD